MNHLWSNLFRNPPDFVGDAIRLCQNNDLFKQLNEGIIRWLVKRMHPRSFKKGEYMFRVGAEGAGAILLLSGSVSIESRGVELAYLQRGDLFGEVALVSGQVRTADAMALEDCETLFFLKTDLDEWIESKPKYAAIMLENLSAMLAKRLLLANEKLSEKEVE